jgi:hypothetical protein
MSGREAFGLSDSTAPFSGICQEGTFQHFPIQQLLFQGKMLGREALSTLGINSPLFIEKLSGRKAFSTFGFISSFFSGKMSGREALSTFGFIVEGVFLVSTIKELYMYINFTYVVNLFTYQIFSVLFCEFRTIYLPFIIKRQNAQNATEMWQAD